MDQRLFYLLFIFDVLEHFLVIELVVHSSSAASSFFFLIMFVMAFGNHDCWNASGNLNENHA